MPKDSETRQFDKRIKELTGEHELARPFLCEGLPFGCEVFLVGINPGTDTAFWKHWNTESGCNKRGWLADYLVKHGVYGPTRKRIEILFSDLKPVRCLETNIFPYPSKRESSLAPTHRDTRVFDFLLEAARPRVVFVHGKSAIEHLAKLTGSQLTPLVKSELPRGQFLSVECRGVTFDVIAGDHLVYQWSDAQVHALANAIKHRLRSISSGIEEDQANTAEQDRRSREADRGFHQASPDKASLAIGVAGSRITAIQSSSRRGSQMKPLTKRQRDILDALKVLRKTQAWSTRIDIGGITGFEKGYSKALGSPTKGKVAPDSLEGRGLVDRKDMDEPFEYRITADGLDALKSD